MEIENILNEIIQTQRQVLRFQGMTKLCEKLVKIACAIGNITLFFISSISV